VFEGYVRTMSSKKRKSSGKKGGTGDVPMCGPLSCYAGVLQTGDGVEFSKLDGDFKKVSEAGWALSRNEPFDVRSFYDSLPKRGAMYPAVARVALLGAVDSGDLPLFDRVRRDMATYAREEKNPYAAPAIELVDVSMRLRLRLSEGYPSWLPQFDFAQVPPEWYPHVTFLGIKVLMERHQFDGALAAAGLARAVNARHDHIVGADVWLNLFSAICCRETRRYAEMEKWFGKAAAGAAKCGMVVPFLEYAMGEGSSLDVALQSLAPDLVKAVRRKVDAFYLNGIRMRNHLTGGHVTERLSRRQFFIARHIYYGLSYKEIADMLHVSLGRVRNLVSEVYELLDVHSRGELEGLVW